MKNVLICSSHDDNVRGVMLKLCLFCLILLGGVIYPYTQTVLAM